MTEQADTLTPALAYAERGWAVLPLHSIKDGQCTCRDPGCSSPGKHPRTVNGVKDATVNPWRIRAWWSSFPDSNIGIATGMASNLAVLDVDAKNNGAETMAELQMQHGPLEGWEVLTGGGGRHFYFAAPPEASPWRNTAGKIAAGVDTRGDGGFVVAPPSLHASGNTYQWTQDAVVAMSAGEPPPHVPRWLLAPLQGAATKPDVVPRNGLIVSAEPTDELAENLIRWAQKKVESGQGRNEAGFDLGCQLRDAGFSEEKQTEAMRLWASLAPAKDHPYTEGEALNSLKSALRQPAREPLPGQSALEAVHNELQTLVSGLPVRLSEAFKEIEPPISWIWEPILPVGGTGSSSIGMIASPGGMGKSTLMVQLAIMLAAGTPLFGEGKVHKKNRILLLQAEGNRSMFKARIRCALHALGLSSDELEIYIQPQEYDFSIARTLPASLEAIHPDVTVLDTVGLFHPGDENSNTEIKKNVMIPLMQLSRQFGSAFMLVHHQNKPNEAREGRYKIRGASAFVDDVDLAMRLEKPKGMSNSIRDLIFDKIRYGPDITKPWTLAYQADSATFRKLANKDEEEEFKELSVEKRKETLTEQEQKEHSMAVEVVARHPGKTAKYLSADGIGGLWHLTKTRQTLNVLCLGENARLEWRMGGENASARLYYLKGKAPEIGG